MEGDYSPHILCDSRLKYILEPVWLCNERKKCVHSCWWVWTWWEVEARHKSLKMPKQSSSKCSVLQVYSWTAGSQEQRETSVVPSLCAEPVEDATAEMSCSVPWNTVLQSRCPSSSSFDNKRKMLFKAGIVESRTVVFGAERGLFAESPKTHALHVRAAACPQPPLTIMCIQVITSLCILLILLSVHQKELSPSSVPCCWDCGSTHRVLMLSDPMPRWKEKPHESSWGVSCQSPIRVLSYSFLTAFLSL